MGTEAGKPLRVLMTGWHYPDEAVLERESFAAAGIAFDVRRWGEGAGPPLSEAECGAYDAIVQHHGAERLREPEAWFTQCRIVVRAGVGVDNIDMAAWGRLGIPVTNVPDYGTYEVADHAIALMMTLVRGTAQFDAALRADLVQGWKYHAPPLIRRLHGAVFGVIGMGPIGVAAARRAAGLGMRVVFYDPFVAHGMELGLDFDRAHELPDLMAAADVVSVHAPGTPKTKNMLDAAAFRHSKPGQIIINTARGSIIDLDALADAIRAGRVGGAGLDVLSVEPPDPAHPLIKAWRDEEPWIKGRVILTPHGGFFSPASSRDLRLKAVRQVLDYVETGRLTTCVNRRELGR
ncbi:MAG: C-terminal binding protein [Rhizobiaceae bacterium]|nr:C-terminal binding protein [Rhizobiaceae bacterium]